MWSCCNSILRCIVAHSLPLLLEPIYVVIVCAGMSQFKRQQLAGLSFALGPSFSSRMAAVLHCLSCVYDSAGYDHEEAVQMFDIVDADHGTLMIAFCCTIWQLTLSLESAEGL